MINKQSTHVLAFIAEVIDAWAVAVIDHPRERPAVRLLAASELSRPTVKRVIAIIHYLLFVEVIRIFFKNKRQNTWITLWVPVQMNCTVSPISA
jgi:hypothetical protein